MKSWIPFKHQNQHYPLDHLAEFVHEFMQPAQDGKLEKAYRFTIEFSLHCFTKSREPHHDAALHYADSREIRVFCFDRYQHSFRLPDIARSVDSVPCFHTGKGNFFVIEQLNSAGEKTEYEVYFKVSRDTKRGWLRLFVQSAYVRDQQHHSSQPKKKKINFFVIAHNVQANKEIKMPK